MDYEKHRRYKGPCIIPLCNEKATRRKLCKYHYRQRSLLTLHCSWQGCVRPICFKRLCRTHYKKITQKCYVECCDKFVYCRNMCITHYRSKKYDGKITCNKCSKNIFVGKHCFMHWKNFSMFGNHCIVSDCKNNTYSRNMCQKHYQRWRRSLS